MIFSEKLDEIEEELILDVMSEVKQNVEIKAVKKRMVGGKKVGNSGEGMHRDQIGINRNERLRVES